MVFDAHGSYTIKVCGEIVCLRFEGSWNLEKAKAFFKEYKVEILNQGFGQFGVMTDFRDLEGATPDCIAFFENIAAWAAQQGQVARAQILDSDLTAYIADSGTMDRDLFLIRSFETEAEALDWLAGQGLRIS